MRTTHYTPEQATALRKAAMDAIFAATYMRLGYLYRRWQDEKEYEDFADFRATAKKLIEDAGAAYGATFIGLSKSPFQITLKLDGVRYFIQANSRAASWGRWA